MIKIFDRYIVKQFIQAFFFSIVSFTFIFVVIDMMENLDDFLDKNVPTNVIIEYYLVFIPEMIRLMIPVSVLLASLFVVGKMSGKNELTAMKSAGVSLYRFMLPLVLTSIIISVATVYFGGYIVPFANGRKVMIEREYMRKNLSGSSSNVFIQNSKESIVTITFYDPSRKLASRVSIQEFSEDNINQIVKLYDAKSMIYNEETNIWILYDAIERKFNGLDETNIHLDSLVLENANFKPEDIIEKQRSPEEMNLTQLRNFAEKQFKSGNDPTRVMIEYHSRISFAFASVIVLIFGIPISAEKRRSGLAVQIGLNLLITFIYLVFMEVSKAFGKNGIINPIITSWFPNILFFIAAIISLIRAQK